MSYDPVTPADFLVMKSQFTSVPTDVITAYIETAGVMVDETWPEKLYRMGIMAFTCHLMTLDGLGTDTASQAFASGMAFQSIKSGSLSLTRFRSEATGSFQDWLSQTICGQQFYQWLRLVKSGPRVACGAGGNVASGYAKDHPFYSWG